MFPLFLNNFICLLSFFLFLLKNIGFYVILITLMQYYLRRAEMVTEDLRLEQETEVDGRASIRILIYAIISIVTPFIGFSLAGLVFSIMALVGAKRLRRKAIARSTRKKLAVSDILGIIGLVISILVTIAVTVVLVILIIYAVIQGIAALLTLIAGIISAIIALITTAITGLLSLLAGAVSAIVAFLAPILGAVLTTIITAIVAAGLDELISAILTSLGLAVFLML